MRYAKALPMNFRFLPGLHGARRTGASQPMQKQHGAKRETQHIRFTLGGLSLGVIFSSRWLCRSRSSRASYLPDGDYPPRPRRGKHCLWLRNIAAALVVDTIRTKTSQPLVVMPEACRGG